MHKNRLMLDDDLGNFLGNLGDDIPRTVADAVRDCSPDVTTYLLCSGSGACGYPSKVGFVSPDAAAFHERGLDPFGLLLRGLKAAGKETFITFRMNDVHNPTEDWNMPRIRREHPEYVVGLDEIEAGKPDWMSYCLDYGRAEVRRHILDIIAEQVEMYGDAIDGFQLDWMRFPRHLSGTPEEVWEKREIITEFTREVRAILSGGERKILLGVRVPTTPAACRRLGFDLAAWGREGLVDIMVTCPFLTSEWLLPLGETRALLDNPSIAVVGGFDLGFGRQPHFPESLRGIATSIYDRGSDGIYMFNFPCWSEYLAARPYHWLAGLGDPRTAAAKPLLLAVEHSRHKIAHIDQPGQLPAQLPANGTLDLTIYVPAAALPAWRALLLVRSYGDVALSLNGRAHESLRYANSDLGVCRCNLFPEIGLPHWKEDERIQPDQCRIFRLADESLLPGVNRLRLTNLTDRELEVERINLGLW